MASFNEMIDRINCRLEQAGQSTRIVEYLRSSVTLNTGHQFSGEEWQTLKDRLLSRYSDLWAKNCDKLLSGEVTVEQIKKEFARLRGLKCQEIHGDKIRRNLNTGVPWIKGKGDLFKGRTHSDETKAKISLKNKGSNNGMWGKKHSQEYKDAHSQRIKTKILNGEFTPNSNNRNTHWDTTFNGRKYRSSWEALYHYHNPTAEYELLRIPYEWENETNIYVVDFIDHLSKLVIEVKPCELCKGDRWNAKWAALNAWALENGYSTILADKEWFRTNIECPDLPLFDEKTAHKIGQLYETGKKNRS